MQRRLIFVHGMNGTAASWNSLPHLFTQSGYQVAAPDLPGHHKGMGLKDLILGGTGRYMSGISMEDYVDAVAAHVPLDGSDQAVLIGHSMGGAVISHVARKYPQNIRQLIYVSAILPDTGESIEKIVQDIERENVPVERTLNNFLPHLDEMQIVQQPVEPLSAVFNRTGAFNQIPKYYVESTEDDVIPVKIQRAMQSKYNFPQGALHSLSLAFSHFPQFDDPQMLFEEIKDIVSVA